MSIHSLEMAKKLKVLGKKLGREEIAKRVLFCVDKMLKDNQYMGTMEFVGRMKAIAQACHFDCYWEEKVGAGFYKEIDDLFTLAEHKENHYYGYSNAQIFDAEKPTQGASTNAK